MAVLALALGAGCGRDASAPPPPPPLTQLEQIDRALASAGGFLRAAQAADGSWRSRHYAALKDGWSLTPLVLAALRFAPGDDASAYPRGVDFVAGVAAAEAPRYPLYALALGALVLNAPGNQRHRGARDAVLTALRARQLSAANGWRPDDASRGGWGYWHAIPTRPDGTVADDLLTSNLSATNLAIGALALAGVGPDDAALVDARGFVERCQNLPPDGDGGFFFSPAVPVGNKAGAAPPGADGAPRWRSYGSMTADGLRALLRLGVAADHPRVVAATAWLDRHFDATRNPGAFDPGDEVRRESSFFYWAWTAAHVARHLGRRAWAGALATELLARQGDDGAWRNRYTELREDDPLVATSFALAALALCRSVLAGEYQSHAATDRGSMPP